VTLNPVPVPTAPLYRLPGRKKKEEGNGEGGGCGRVLGDGRGTRESLQATEAIWNATVLLAALEPDAGAEFLAAAGPHRRDDVRTHTHTHTQATRSSLPSTPSPLLITYSRSGVRRRTVSDD
jgi:hypothetical protein